MKRLRRYLGISSKYAALLYLGGSTYLTVEVFYRNNTDISMFWVGGAAFLLVGGLNKWLPWDMAFIWQMISGGLVITLLELVAGLVLNVWLGLGIWDYSDITPNFMGQICLPFSLIWVGLSAVIILLDDYVRHYVFGEDKPRYRLI